MSRAYMSFRHIEYGPYVIRLMDGNEPGYAEGVPLLVSIAGPGLPRLRLTETGPHPLSDEDGGTAGLLVFGNFKGDRPPLGPREDNGRGDKTARLDVRMSPDLKDWVLDNGGSEMVRRLIEQARLAP